SSTQKWIHFFEGITSILFCVDICGYDKPDGKEPSHLEQSMVFFQPVINSRWFLRTSIILYLNNIDSFRSKLLNSPLENYFPEYTGGQDVNKAVKYLLWRFLQTNKARLSIYPHLTSCNDPNNLKIMFAVVKETVRQRNQY
ncbi:hypothetical protein M422DRAFT_181468, partial [Sphaerobolus stellatus SS14]